MIMTHGVDVGFILALCEFYLQAFPKNNEDHFKAYMGQKIDKVYNVKLNLISTKAGLSEED